MAKESTQDGAEVVRVIAEPCRRCRRLIEVTSPTWYTVNMDLRDLKRPRFSYSYEPNDTALCVECCLASKAPDERDSWERKLNTLLRRKQHARVPSEVTLFHHRDKNTFVFDRTNAVHHTDFYFMLSRAEPHPSWRVPTWTFRPDDGTPPTVHIWVGADLTLEGITASIQVTWNASRLDTGQSNMQIVDWDRSTHEEVKRLMDTTRFLYPDAGLWRGRSPRRTSLTEGEFLEAYETARQQCLQDGFPPTANNLLRFLPISKATLVRYRKMWLPNDKDISDAN